MIEETDPDAMISKCLICEKPVPDYEPVFCCNGLDCGCMGLPTEPCICSDKCYDALMKGIGKEYNQRRIDAGIERWELL
jgi:hypothetical protein